MDHMPPRPGSVITAAVLMFVYGGLMLVCTTCSAAGLVLADPAADEVMAKEVPAYEFLKIAQVVSGLILGVVMILLGIMVLQLKPLARLGTYLVCSYDLLTTLAINIYSVIFIFPATERMAAELAKNNPPVPFDIAAVTQGSLWLNLALSVLLTLGFCVPIMLCLSGAKARAAFADEFDAPDADRRERRRYDYDDDDDLPPVPPRSSGETGITDRPS